MRSAVCLRLWSANSWPALRMLRYPLPPTNRTTKRVRLSRTVSSLTRSVRRLMALALRGPGRAVPGRVTLQNSGQPTPCPDKRGGCGTEPGGRGPAPAAHAAKAEGGDDVTGADGGRGPAGRHAGGARGGEAA